MVASSTMPSNSCHFRSISMPSQSHPLVLRVEEELNKLRVWQTSSSASTYTAESLSCGLDHLNILYSTVEDLLHLSATQHALSCVDKKWMNDMLDDSLLLLDIYSTIKNDLLHLKEKLHDLQSVLRLRRGEQVVSARIESYLHTRKKMKKEMSKCLGVLKTMESRSILFMGMIAFHNQNQDKVSVVVDVLRELRDINITTFRTLALFVFGYTRPKSGARRWPIISRVLGIDRVSCEGVEGIKEMGNVDVSLHILHTNHSSKIAKEVRVQNAQRQLVALEICIKGLEVGSECMFRHLIQTRVSLLNLFTQ